MNSEDDSLLSAYLDGELSLADRLEFESALMADSGLARRARDLGSVRDLVAGLERPVIGRDMGAEITERIGGLKPSSFAWVGGRRLPKMRLRVAGLSAAASVLLALTLAFLSNPLGGNGDRPPIASAPQVPAPTAPTTSPVVVAHVSEAAPAEAVAVRPPVAAVPVSSPVRDTRAVNDDLRLRNQLDSRRVSKVIFVRDRNGSSAEQRVYKLLEETPRIEPTFSRVDVAEGLTIDPAHPEAAKVFVVSVSAGELAQLRKDLQGAFPGALEETTPDAGVVMQLGALDRFVVRSGTRVTPVKPVDPTAAQLAAKPEPEDQPAAVGDSAPAPDSGSERLHSGPFLRLERHKRVLPPNSDPEDFENEVVEEQPRANGDRAVEKNSGASAKNVAAGAGHRRKQPAIVLIWISGAAR
jgi:anti-sigma factor RsiW